MISEVPKDPCSRGGVANRVDEPAYVRFSKM